VALFGFGKEKRESGSSELVLAYLEDAQRVRTPFLLKDKRKVDVQATVQGVDEDAGTVSFQVTGGIFEKGARLEFLFIQENLRMGGATRISEARSGIVVAELPDELELMERRKQPRARLNPKEGANLTALTNLFEGVGVNGAMENLSEGGCRVRVEKALNIKDEKRLPLGTALLPKGQAFMVLKLNKVPKCPSVMEITGKVAYLDDSGGGLALGVEFDKLRGDYASAIKGLVSSRTGSIPSSVPAKARRKAIAESSPSAGEELDRSRPAPARPAPPEARPAAPRAEAPAPAPEAPAAAPDPEPPAPPRNPALLRLKKRTRTVVVMAPPAYGQLLRDFLMEDGYGRVLLASTPEELAGGIRQPNVGMAFIDSEMPILECFEMVSQLHEEDPEMPPVVVAAQEVSRALVLAAHRSNVSQLVVKPYSLDEAFTSMLEQQMGL
jgi:CheY-like chemotaxis protein/c-di-GMP-binding flagellar brake protein YcgR